MSKNASVLIVENDPAQITSFSDSIEYFNKRNPIKITPDICDNLNDALTAISTNAYDGAILDLKLSEGKPEGNDIIKSIVNIKRFPVIVYSGFIGDLDPEIPRSIFFQPFEKSKDFLEILNILAKIYNTGVTEILARRGKLEELIDSIFWRHLSNSLDYWFTEKNELTLLRYTLNHAIEYLEIDSKGEFVNYNPAEVYINSPIKPFPFTGTILKKKGKDDFFIILSPPCDLAHAGKSKCILLAEIEPLSIPIISDQKTILKNVIPQDITPDVYAKHFEKREKARGTLTDIFMNNYANKYHFLPDCPYFQGGLINYQLLQSLSHDEIASDYNHVVSVTSSFCKDIIARFSYYYSRQGSPDFDFKSLLKRHIKPES